MSALPLTIATRSYDFVLPLALGDVAAEGLDLTVVRGFRILERVLTDPAIHGGGPRSAATSSGWPGATAPSWACRRS